MDAFAELGLPRSPAVDEQALSRRFDELSRSRHPDAGGDPISFAQLAEARQTLCSPARRFRHLLELQFPGTRLDGALSSQLMDLFTSLGPALQAAQDVERRKAAATTALARALLAPEEMHHRESLEDAAATLAARLHEVTEAADDWDGTAATLAAWSREAAFLEKWQAQVRDQLARLGS